MTLREASERTSRSVTTLRRYIRAGRLRAEKKHGRYGPEYFVSEQALAEAGLEPDRESPDLPARPADLTSPALGHMLRESIPLSVFQELQMKHEQLLVQYGMFRAGGLRLLEIQSELDAKRDEVEDCREEIARLKDKLRRETARLRKRLRESELELEGRRLEGAALKEKLRALERLMPGRAPRGAVDRQLSGVAEQTRRIRALGMEKRPDGSWGEAAAPTNRGEPDS